MASMGEKYYNQGQRFHCIIRSFVCLKLQASFKASKTALSVIIVGV
jgi:hypothetical protein